MNSKCVQYIVSIEQHKAHYFEVCLLIDDPDPGGQQVALPAWIPGSYMIRDFSRNIVEIHASANGYSVPLSKLDKQTWCAAPVDSRLEINYRVYAWDLSVRSAYLDQTRGFFNGTSVFLRVVGKEALPHFVSLPKPDTEQIRNWKVATALIPDEIDEKGWGGYVADDYQHLIDCPVELSDFQSVTFAVVNRPHRFIVSGRADFDQTRIHTDLSKICAHHAEFFGDLPVNSYLFITQVVAEGYGGLEHRDSTVLLCSREDLPRRNLSKTTEAYRRLLGLCSHEYFHLWNVKRIRPETLASSDLATEAYTELLWAFEGITSYYDDLALLRCGCIETSEYLELVAHTITRVMRGPARKIQSVAESSFDAWTKFYKQDENAPNAVVSYYAKGMLSALGLDMLIRQITAETRSLDDLMRLLWQRYGKLGIGVPEYGIEQLCDELTGRDCSDFFASYVHGTVDLPLHDWFQSLGIGFRLRPAQTAKDKGGAIEHPDNVFSKPWLGATFIQSGDFVKIQNVFDGGAAQASGLAPGDKVIALDGLQVTAENLFDRISRLDLNHTVEILALRRDEIMRFDFRPEPAQADTCELWWIPEAQCTEAQLTRRNNWLQL